MKLSCNGCRILRKGCSEDCIIRPCLEWINSPESQANATLFLAKFYGRAGLLNLINAAQPHLRAAVFKSLMYEACGRIVNPAYGALGLFWTGEWARCQTAVDAVLNGSEIITVEPSDWEGMRTRGSEHGSPVLDIRHVSKRTGNVIRPKPRIGSVDSAALWNPVCGEEQRGRERCRSRETYEASLIRRDKQSRNGVAELNLELTLGSGFSASSVSSVRGYGRV
ncbi:LOB domain-containing protein 40-like [Abrus precatorius]|uniref:LOB domain-containing protein 40-like n=1 Tax=Abrus precatorius TaxID=3816 RepID=A0A8B8M6J0_ABRPR|nr:LOB domain-containing protein 40-like [Abrus precatorius]